MNLDDIWEDGGIRFILLKTQNEEIDYYCLCSVESSNKLSC